MNIAVLVTVVSFILFAGETSNTAQSAARLAKNDKQVISNPLDRLSSADIAYNIALLVDMPESAAVAHEKDAENTRATVISSDPLVASKPTIITTELKTAADITEHSVSEGEDISTISKQYSISEDSIRWSNAVSQNQELTVNSVILVPPIEGVIYDVVEGDTVEELAEEFRTNVEKIVAFNDTEIEGLLPGKKIVIPDGQIISAASNNFASSFSAAYGFNSYAPGNCTWHTANRWASLGKSLPSNLGNAATWVSRAKIAGLQTGSIPRLHAAIQTSTGGYGHVGFVEEVYEDGSIRISEMNYNWQLYALRDKVISADEAAGYNYIY